MRNTKRAVTVFALSAGLLLSCSLKAQDELVCSSDLASFSMSSSLSWSEVEHPGMDDLFEMINRNRNLRLTVWYEDERTPAAEYLEDRLQAEGMTRVGENYLTNVDGSLATTVNAEYLEMRRPYRSLVLALPSDSGMLVIQFSCPADCFREHKSQLHALIGSISLGKESGLQNFFAEARH